MAFTIYDADMAPTTAEEYTLDAGLAFSPTSAVPVGKLAICLLAAEQTTTSNESDSTRGGITDSKANTWLTAAEGVQAQGDILVGIYYSIITTQIETTDTISIALTANGTPKGATLCAFTRDTGASLAVAGKAYEFSVAGGSTDYTVSVSGLTSEEHLWVGSNAMRHSTAQTNAIDASYTAITQGGAGQWGTAGHGSGQDAAAAGGYLISTGTSETYDDTGNVLANRVTALVAFREIAAGGGGGSMDPFGTSGFFGA